MIQTLFRDFTHLVLIVGVLAFLLLLRRGFYVVRLKPATRNMLDRGLPALEAIVGSAFVFWAISLFLPDDTRIEWWIWGAIAAVFLGAGWFAIRDLVSGIVLRSENAFKVGQWIKTDEIDGFITQLGYRTIEIETDKGLQIKMPYSKIAKTILATADRTKASHTHTFFLEMPANHTVAELTSSIRTAALTSFWSSPIRDPYIHYIQENNNLHQFEITVFSMNEAYATDLERSIRRQLEEVLV